MKNSLVQASVLEEAFAQDLLEGLQKPFKSIPSKYFYDARGDALFQQIMQLPEYYLTRAEYEILSQQAADILAPWLQSKRPLALVELGAGDGFKTKLLLDCLLQHKTEVHYFPMDISGSVLAHLQRDLAERYPKLVVHPIEGDYFEALQSYAFPTDMPKLLLFLGANIGNYSVAEAKHFYKMLSEALVQGDAVLSGFDLQKHPATILAAYNDAQGITRAFNLNLLERINRTFEGNFPLHLFRHYPLYDPETGLAKSFLVCEQACRVQLKKLNFGFSLAAGEVIFTEISRKYRLDEIAQLAEQQGFEVLQNYFDCKHYFVNSLWQKRD